jgi:hypothetical protein
VKTFAHIIDGVVVNVSLWDGESDWTSPEEIVQIPQDSSAGIGWEYINGEFINNSLIEHNETIENEVE